VENYYSLLIDAFRQTPRDDAIALLDYHITQMPASRLRLVAIRCLCLQQSAVGKQIVQQGTL